MTLRVGDELKLLMAVVLINDGDLLEVLPGLLPDLDAAGPLHTLVSWDSSFIRRHKIIVVFLVVGPLNNKWFSFPEIPDEFLKAKKILKVLGKKTAIHFREKIDASKVFWIIKQRDIE